MLDDAQETFLRTLLRTARGAGLLESPDLDLQGFTLRFPSGRSLQLAPGAKAWREAPDKEARQAVIEAWVRKVLEPEAAPTSWEEARTRLGAALRAASWGPLRGLQQGASGASQRAPILRPLEADLVVACSVERESSRTWVDEEELQAWGIDAETLWEAALAPPGGGWAPGWEAQGAGLWRAAPQAGWDPPLALLVGGCAPPQAEPGWLAACPTEGGLWAADPGVAGSASRLESRIEQGLREPHGLSAGRWRWDGSGWVRLPDDAGLVQIQRAAEYQRQEDPLRRIHGPRAQDPQPAPYQIAQGADGPSSFTVWVEGLPLLLPEVDQVVFARVARGGQALPLARAPWARVQQLLGDRMEPLELQPPRWRVSTFPSREELQELAAATP